MRLKKESNKNEEDNNNKTSEMKENDSKVRIRKMKFSIKMNAVLKDLENQKIKEVEKDIKILIQI